MFNFVPWLQIDTCGGNLWETLWDWVCELPEPQEKASFFTQSVVLCPSNPRSEMVTFLGRQGWAGGSWEGNGAPSITNLV